MAQQNGNRPPSSRARRAARGLGTLEGQLMEALWATDTHLSVQEACDALGPGHNYKTVMTVLNRLVEKELLDRNLDGRAYRYHPRQPRDRFLREAADELVKGYLSSYGNSAAGHLTGAVDAAMPRPAEAGPTTTSPWSRRPTDDERTATLIGVVVIAIALQIVTLLLRRSNH